MGEALGYVKFTGEYSKLKGMGYVFQKLYAGNYMQWCNNGFRVWKRGSDITHDDVDLYKLVKFLESAPVVRERNGGIAFFKFYRDGALDEYDYCGMTEENVSRYRKFMTAFSSDDYDESNPPEYLGDSMFVKNELIDHINSLKERNWYELSEYEEVSDAKAG